MSMENLTDVFIEQCQDKVIIDFIDRTSTRSASHIVETSFSRRLIDVLLNLKNAVTVAQVHAKLVNQANNPRNNLD